MRIPVDDGEEMVARRCGESWDSTTTGFAGLFSELFHKREDVR